MRKVFLLGCVILILAVHLGICDSIANTDATTIAEARPIYIINVGAQLLITVFGHDELTALVTVRPDGKIAYPMAGDVDAAGSTIVQLSSVIGKRLSDLGYYEDPQVTVQLKEPGQEIIYIFGDVKEPGQKRFSEPVNVVEVLAAAGGYIKTADLANARIRKKQGEVISVDLENLLKKDIIDQGVVNDELLTDRFTLENGDVLIIPSIIKEDQITIIGHVQEPGHYSVESAISLVEALALAGGTSKATADLRHIKIIKADGSVVIADATRAWNETDEKHTPSDSLSRQTEMPNPDYQKMVQPGDNVFVPQKGQINILGSVKSQGQFSVDGEISIIEALALAGVAEDANLKKLRIVRSTGEQVTIDVSKIWKQSGREIEEKLIPGDTLIVPRAFKINWSAISTVVLLLSTLYAIFR